VKNSLPFALTIKYIFVNRSLQRRFGIEAQSFSDPLEFLEATKSAHRKVSLHGMRAFAFSRVEHLLSMVGAVYPAEGGGFACDRQLTQRCLECLHSSDLPLFHDPEIPNIFATGHAIYANHWSFTCSELLERVDFEWEALPVPLKSGRSQQSFLSVLAVPRTAIAKRDAFLLATQLVSKSAQNHFAKVGGNLPVRSSAIPTVAEADWQHLSLDSLNQALATSDFNWPHRDWGRIEYALPLNLQTDLLSGRRQVCEIFQRVEEIVNATSQ
jgi:hypothetical protein